MEHRCAPKPSLKGITRSKLEDFVVQADLGTGSFARVFKVCRKQDGAVYALKKVRITSMSRKEVGDALGEIRFLASIRHPALVRYYDSFLDQRTMELCVVMEYADAGDLAAKVSACTKLGAHLSEEAIWTYFLQMLEGLAYLHHKRILHRDIKSANCFLTKDGSLKLGDLNVSKLQKLGLARTQTGTPFYMSPEIYQHKAYDDKSDVWSAGCVLYEMCALKPPFRGRDLDDLGRRVAMGAYPRIPTQYSQALADVIGAMLTVDHKKRPSASQILVLPEVARRRAALLAASRSPMKDRSLLEASAPLIDTIAVPMPAAYRKLADALPSPKFPRKDAATGVPISTGVRDAEEGGEDTFYAKLLAVGVRESTQRPPQAAAPTSGVKHPGCVLTGDSVLATPAPHAELPVRASGGLRAAAVPVSAAFLSQDGSSDVGPSRALRPVAPPPRVAGPLADKSEELIRRWKKSHVRTSAAEPTVPLAAAASVSAVLSPPTAALRLPALPRGGASGGIASGRIASLVADARAGVREEPIEPPSRFPPLAPFQGRAHHAATPTPGIFPTSETALRHEPAPQLYGRRHLAAMVGAGPGDRSRPDWWG